MRRILTAIVMAGLLLAVTACDDKKTTGTDGGAGKPPVSPPPGPGAPIQGGGPGGVKGKAAE